MNRLFTYFIVTAMIAGVAAGYACNQYLAPDQAKQAAGLFGLATDGFLRLIRMIIAPLVFSTLVVGIAQMEDAAAVGRVGAKTMFLFVLSSLLSLGVGLMMVGWLEPGAGLHLKPGVDAAAAAVRPAVQAGAFSLKDFIIHLIPVSIVDAMARNEILQIVVFSLFVGAAIASLDDRAPQVLALIEQIARIMLKVTGYVMRFAPVAIFAAIAKTVTESGLAILITYARFVGDFYMSLGLLWVVLLLACALSIGLRALSLFAAVRQPVLLAFSTATSEAAYPRTLEQLQAFGLSPKIASFVLPLGYSFNLTGSMMYMTFATLFIAQAYDVPLSLGQQITLLLLLLVTSKGMAGVPRAAIVVLYATLGYFRLPEAGLALILAVDHLLDMGRSATNVLGNSVAAVIVGRWEGQLKTTSAPAVAPI